MNKSSLNKLLEIVERGITTGDIRVLLWIKEFITRQIEGSVQINEWIEKIENNENN